MAGEHIKPMQHAIESTRQERREAIAMLNASNNTKNRANLIQIHETMKVMEIWHEEKNRD